MHVERGEKKKQSWPQSQTNEAVACMTGAERQCQGALCSLGLVFSPTLDEKVSVMQNETGKLRSDDKKDWTSTREEEEKKEKKKDADV